MLAPAGMEIKTPKRKDGRFLCPSFLLFVTQHFKPLLLIHTRPNTWAPLQECSTFRAHFRDQQKPLCSVQSLENCHVKSQREFCTTTPTSQDMLVLCFYYKPKKFKSYCKHYTVSFKQRASTAEKRSYNFAEVLGFVYVQRAVLEDKAAVCVWCRQPLGVKGCLSFTAVTLESVIHRTLWPLLILKNVQQRPLCSAISATPPVWKTWSKT